MTHDFGQGNRLWSLGWIVLIAAALLAAGCEESTEVDPDPGPALPPGEGTQEAPFVVQPGELYTQIPISQFGRVFFVLDNMMDGGMHTIETASPDDVDLIVHDLFGPPFSGEVCTPFLFGGNEECWIVPEPGIPQAYITVNAFAVPPEGSAFDIGTPLGFQRSGTLASGMYADFDGFAPMIATMSGRLQVPVEHMYYEIADGTPGFVPFPGNAFINRCDANEPGLPTGPDVTCSIPSFTGMWPFMLSIFNNGIAADNFTITLTAP